MSAGREDASGRHSAGAHARSTAPGKYLHNPHLPGEAFALDGSGPNAVLLFHGFTATPNEVLGLGLALQQAGYSVYGPMLAGHGSHPRELNRTRWQDWTAQAEQAFDELTHNAQRSYRRIIVGGESNGALIALYLAAARPEASAVLAYAPAIRLRLKPVERVLLNLLAPLGLMLPKGDLRGNTTWQGYRANPLRAVTQVQQFQAEVRGRLPEVCQPALIVQGRRDQTVDPRGAEEVHAGIGSAVKELACFEEAPHCLLISKQREAVYELTVRFLRRTIG